MVAVAGARRAAQLGAERRVLQEGVEQPAQPAVVDLAAQVLEEAVELVEVAVGHRQEVGGVHARRVGSLDRAQVHHQLVAEALGTALDLHQVALLELGGEEVRLAERARGHGTGAIAQLERQVRRAGPGRQTVLARAGEDPAQLGAGAQLGQRLALGNSGGHTTMLGPGSDRSGGGAGGLTSRSRVAARRRACVQRVCRRMVTRATITANKALSAIHTGIATAAHQSRSQDAVQQDPRGLSPRRRRRTPRRRASPAAVPPAQRAARCCGLGCQGCSPASGTLAALAAGSWRGLRSRVAQRSACASPGDSSSTDARRRASASSSCALLYPGDIVQRYRQIVLRVADQQPLARVGEEIVVPLRAFSE